MGKIMWKVFVLSLSFKITFDFDGIVLLGCVAMETLHKLLKDCIKDKGSAIFLMLHLIWAVIVPPMFEKMHH